jgi:hypothetical protein
MEYNDSEVFIPLLAYEKTLLSQHFEIFQDFEPFSSTQRQSQLGNSSSAVFTHWLWSFNLQYSFHTLVERVNAEPTLSADADKMWKLYLSYVRAESAEVNEAVRRMEEIQIENPRLRELVMRAYGSQEVRSHPRSYRPWPSTPCQQDIRHWKMLTVLKYMDDTYGESTLIDVRRDNSAANMSPALQQEQLQPVQTYHSRGTDTASSRDWSYMRELPWPVPYLGPTILVSALRKKWAFEIWSLIRVNAIMMRRKPRHLEYIKEALTQCSFQNLYFTFKGLYIPLRLAEPRRRQIFLDIGSDLVCGIIEHHFI